MGSPWRWRMVMTLFLTTLLALESVGQRPWSAVAAAAIMPPTTPSPWPPTSLSPPPRLSAAAALLMDARSGRVLHHVNGFTSRPPASTTKVLTAIVALERGRLDDVVTVSDRAARTEGSSMYLRAGERYTLRELLHGLLLNSGNDAAVAVAEHVAGSVEAFADLMNQRARSLGAKNSHFVNPHGLHVPHHYSTAFDLALITRHALNLPVFATIVRQREAEIWLSQSQRPLTLRNTNRLLWMFEGADGVKTGTTSAAGACLISSATRAEGAGGTEQKFIAVVLHAGSRWRDSVRLLEWGYENFHSVIWAAPQEAVMWLPVSGGQEPRLPLTVDGYVAAVLPRRHPGRVTVDWDLPPQATAPVAAGDVMGTLRVRVDGQTQSTLRLVAAETVPSASLSTRLVRPWVPWLEWLGRRGWL